MNKIRDYSFYNFCKISFDFMYIPRIYPHDLQESDGGVIDTCRASNYSDLLPKMPRYCCRDEIFFIYFF